MHLNLQILVKAGLVEGFEFGVDYRQGRQVDKVGGRRAAGFHQLHKSIYFGPVRQIHVKGPNLPREPLKQGSQLVQVTAALGQHQGTGVLAQQPLDQRPAHIAGGTGDKVCVRHGVKSSLIWQVLP